MNSRNQPGNTLPSPYSLSPIALTLSCITCVGENGIAVREPKRECFLAPKVASSVVVVVSDGDTEYNS